MKKQQADKPIDEELLMRMMAGEIEKLQSNGDAPETEETGQEAEEPEQETEKRVVEHLYEAWEKEKNIPAKLNYEMSLAYNRAYSKWLEAKQAADYDTTFLKGMDIPARYGKPVYVRREYHERIAKISMMLTGGKVSLSAYIDNVLHFEQYREEIEAAYAGKIENLF